MARVYSSAIRGNSADLITTRNVPLTTSKRNLYSLLFANNWSKTGGGSPYYSDTYRINNWLWEYPEGVSWSDIETIRFDFGARQNDSSASDYVKFQLQLVTTSGSNAGNALFADLTGDNDFVFRNYVIEDTPANWGVSQTEFESMIAGGHSWKVGVDWEDFGTDDFEMYGLYMTIGYDVSGPTGLFTGVGSF